MVPQERLKLTGRQHGLAAGVLFDDAQYTVDFCRRLTDEDEWAALEAASSYMEMHDIDPSPAMDLARRYYRALGYDHDVIERLEGILERMGKV